MQLTELIMSGLPVNTTKKISSPTELSSYYPPITGYRFNFVTSLGSSLNAESSTITSRWDREVLKLIRSNSNLIVTTGKTAVSEDLHHSKFAPILVLTSTEILDCRLTRETGPHTLFISQNEQHYRNSKVQFLGPTSNPLGAWLLSQTARYPGVVLEVGIATARKLSNLVKEFDITVTGAKGEAEASSACNRVIQSLNAATRTEQLIEIDGDYFFKLVPK